MKEYINDLRVPNGHLHYDQIFDRAIENVGMVWTLVASGVLTGDEAFVSKIGNWYLDTGKDPSGHYVFWS